MNFDINTLNTQKPLWIDLSDLFLDTEMQEFTHSSIANEMKESGYSLVEIEEILMLEVFPVFIGNLNSVTVEWAGFNEESVCEAIIAVKHPNRFRRWLNQRSYWMIKDDWQKIV